MQQLPNIERNDSREKMSDPKLAKYNGRRKICVNFKTDRDKMSFVVYRYLKSLNLQDNEVDLKMTGNQTLLAKSVYLLSYNDIVFKPCIVLDEIVHHN